jgi:hypothetical protein
MNTENKEKNGGVSFGSSISLGGLAMVVIQTIVLIATTVGIFSSYMGKIDKLMEDQEIIRKELQTMRTEVITRNEASVQFSFINDQLRRQDGAIRELQSTYMKKGG